MTKKNEYEAQIWALIADLHVGSTTGLASEPANAVQKALLSIYNEDIAWFGDAPDRVVVLGDAIDGLDKKSKDLTQLDMFDQAEDAAKLIARWNAKEEYILVSGTPYHVSAEAMNFERHVISELKSITGKKVTFVRKLKTRVNGWFLLEGRHKIGSSTIAHSRKTSMERSKFWNVINAALSARSRGEKVEWPHLCLFAHVHYYGFADDDFGASMTLPCYQALGGQFGDEACDGHVSVGCSRLFIGKDEEDGWLARSRTHLPGMTNRTVNR